MSKRERKDPAYLREQGKREAKGAKQRKIAFSFTKINHQFKIRLPVSRVIIPVTCGELCHTT